MSWYNIRGLIREICSRTKLDRKNFTKLVVEEIVDVLNGEVIGIEEIRERLRYAVVLFEGKVNYFSGDVVEKVVRAVSAEDYSTVREVRGIAGYKGVARGVAKVLMTDRDLPKIKQGDILVANLTNPSYDPAFSKIAAVVTDEGGVLCHSAIMAREFKIPCIIGTKIATQVLKDGDKVEVDANNGIVRKLSR